MQHQNMIASSTRDHVWARHITDSAQFLLHAPANAGGVWLDLGSGPGLSGLILAMLSGWRADMVESRRGRIHVTIRIVAEVTLKQCSGCCLRLETLNMVAAAKRLSVLDGSRLGRD